MRQGVSECSANLIVNSIGTSRARIPVRMSFALGRNGQSLVSPLLSHWLGAAHTPSWYEGLMDLKAKTAGGSPTSCNQRASLFLKGRSMKCISLAATSGLAF